MSRATSDSYKCHKCGTEHSTENMVAYCAWCFAAAEAELRAYKRAGPGDERTKRALDIADFILGGNNDFTSQGQQAMVELARSVRAAWKSLADMTKERDEWKAAASGRTVSCVCGGSGLAKAREKLAAAENVVAAARAIHNRYIKGENMTRGTWVEIAYLDIAFEDYDAALKAAQENR